MRTREAHPGLLEPHAHRSRARAAFPPPFGPLAAATALEFQRARTGCVAAPAAAQPGLAWLATCTHSDMAFQGRCPTWLGVAAMGAMVWIGCEPPTPSAPRKPVETEIVEAPLDAVWDATVEWFATRGLPIKNIDKTSGLLATEHVMPTAQAETVMSCGTPGPKPNGKVEHADHRTHFNVLLRAQGPRQTKVTVNAFFDCLVNTYENVGLLRAGAPLLERAPQVRLHGYARAWPILSRLEKVKTSPATDAGGSATAAPSAEP